jgi:hypothetical protein
MRYVQVGVASLLCILGVIFNLLCIWMFGRVPSIRDTTRFLLKMLSAADAMFIIISAVLVISPPLMYTSESIRDGDFARYYFPYIVAIFEPLWCIVFMVSVWMVVAVIADRYVNVCRPLFAARHSTVPRVRQGVCIIWIASVIFTMPRFFEHTVEPGNGFRLELTAVALNGLFAIVYRLCLCLIFHFLLPFSLVTFFLVHLIRSVRRFSASSGRRVPMTDDHSVDNARHLTVMLNIVVVVFIIFQTIAQFCDLYLLSMFLFVITGHDDLTNYQYHLFAYKYVNMFGVFPLLVSASVKFIVYVTANPICRRTLRQCFCCSRATDDGFVDDNSQSVIELPNVAIVNSQQDLQKNMPIAVQTGSPQSAEMDARYKIYKEVAF